MTTTYGIAAIQDRILNALDGADVPSTIVGRLCSLVWELDDCNEAIDSSIAEIERQVVRLRSSFQLRHYVIAESRTLESLNERLAERLADRAEKFQLIMQLVGILHDLTGISPSTLRSAVFEVGAA